MGKFLASGYPPRLENLVLGSRGIVLSSKVLISCGVIVHLICAFVFAYANSRSSNDMAQITGFEFLT